MDNGQWVNDELNQPIKQPPNFRNAANTRQKARAAGLDPNYWYAVESVANVKPGQVVEVIFWKHTIALYRDMDGVFHAVENRCAHRQLKLSLGTVDGYNIRCAYHGWAYSGDGCLIDVPHALFGHTSLPKLQLRSYPLTLRYGLIWLFPGDPKRADTQALPDIPELEAPDRWTCVPLSFTWKTHHSMVIDNVSDFTHAHLHRKYRPFGDAELTRLETIDDNVHLEYDTEVGRGRISGLFVDHKSINTNHMELCYQYPYQWSNTGDQIKHWLFVLPIDERTTKTFFLFYFKSLKIPLTNKSIPRSVMTGVMKIANHLLIKPLLDQDRFAIEAEQLSYEQHWNAPPVEFNPAVRAFQQVTIRKWQAYLEDQHTNSDDPTQTQHKPTALAD